MGRLTIKDEQGNWALKGVKWNQLHVGETITQQVQEKIYGALAKLKDYEDSGMTPDECWDCCVGRSVKTMEEVKEELKPCPFCGGKASINYEHISGEHKGFWAQVICNSCYGRSGGTWAGSYNAAERIEIKAWNRRVNDGKID